MALLRLNAMRKFIANVKHHIDAHIYTDVNIITFYANIYNIFTAYVKVQTYSHTHLRHVCRASKCGIMAERHTDPHRSVDKSAIQFSNSSNILRFTFSINFSNFHAIIFNFLIFLIVENFIC